MDKETRKIRKFEGNPEHPGSRGRNCAKGPATINQVDDPERILYPMKRVGKRGGGQWERVTWDEVLDDMAGRIRKALEEDRRNEIMYHVGRPGHELLYHQRIMHAWGIDAHNSHTNVCSAGARTGYAFWCGIDRPSPDHANSRFMLLLSSHLETGHYFNPHAQRIIEAKERGAKVCVIDTRLSNTASKADYWMPTWPGTEAAVLLAICNVLLQEDLYDREFVRKWGNWEQFLRQEHPDEPPTFEAVRAGCSRRPLRGSTRFGVRRRRVRGGRGHESLAEVAEVVARAPARRLSTHVWRSAAAGNLGGWEVARALAFLVNVAAREPMGGARRDRPERVEQSCSPARSMHAAAGTRSAWNDAHLDRAEYPLSLLRDVASSLPHLIARAGRGKPRRCTSPASTTRSGPIPTACAGSRC